MKRHDYSVLGLAATMTLFFGWLIAVTGGGADSGLQFVRLVMFAMALDKLTVRGRW